MKCACGDDFRKFWEDETFIWLCPTCGRATWSEGHAVYVPAQAKSHAAFREVVVMLAKYAKDGNPFSFLLETEQKAIDALAVDTSLRSGDLS